VATAGWNAPIGPSRLGLHASVNESCSIEPIVRRG